MDGWCSYSYVSLLWNNLEHEVAVPYHDLQLRCCSYSKDAEVSCSLEVLTMDPRPSESALNLLVFSIPLPTLLILLSCLPMK